VCRADNLTTLMCPLSSNLGVSTSWNPQDLFSPVQGLLYLQVTLKVQWNDKAVGRNKVGKTQRMVGFTVCCLESEELQFPNIFSANNVVIVCTVDLLHYFCQILKLKFIR
jgi:hypothetical protein